MPHRPWRHSTIVLTLGAGVSWLATQVFAWQHGFHPSLGVPWGTYATVPLYAPWALWAWLWTWPAARSWVHLRLVVVTLGGGSILAALGVWWWTRPRAMDARWAGWWDMWHAHVLGRTGVVLGYWRGRTLRYGGDMHLLMVAPTGTRKTTTVVIPTMLEWQDSLIVNDPKGELYSLTAGYRSQFSRCIRLNPTDPTSDRLDPLGQIRLGTDHCTRDVSLVAGMLTAPEMGARVSGVEKHFQDLATTALEMGIVHGLSTGQATNLKELDDLFQGTGSFEDLLVEMVGTAHTPEGPHPVVLRGVSILKKLAEKELSGVLSTLARALQWTVDPLAARLVECSDFMLQDLRDAVRPMTVYLTVPYSDQDRLSTLLRLLVRQMLDYATQDIRPHPHRLLILLDEAQTLQHMAAIPSIMQFGRGYGLHLMVIVPSLQEVQRLYGDHHTFMESSHARLVFAPNDPTVAAQFSRMGGEYREYTGRRQWGARQPWKEVRLLSETTLMHLPEDRGVLFLGNGGFPAITTKSPYYTNPVWAHRAALKAPAC